MTNHNLCFNMLADARRWARAWKRKASGEGKSGFVRLLVKRDHRQKARIAELEAMLRKTTDALHAAEVQLRWPQSDILGNAREVLEKP